MAVETVEVMAAVVQDRVIHKRAGQCEKAAIVKGVFMFHLRKGRQDDKNRKMMQMRKILMR